MRAFVEFYNRKNREQVYEIYGMIKLEKMCIPTAENLRNYGIYQMIEILLVLRNAYMIPRDQNILVFYINNYINWDQFNKFYDLD